MSACFQAYGSDPVVSDLFSNMSNDRLFQLRILSKHAVAGGPAELRSQGPLLLGLRGERERGPGWGWSQCLLNFSR